jgi:predicted RNA-binding Zn-ribbon protein involved in translation (DUF1610 family)
VTTLISETQHLARKARLCNGCGQIIAKGTRYNRQFCTNDGEGYTWVEHMDCRALANKLHSLWGFDEGIPPLFDMCSDTLDLDYWRGHFPHVITRLELREQKWEATQ